MVKWVWLLFGLLVLACAWQASGIRPQIVNASSLSLRSHSDLPAGGSSSGVIDIPVTGVPASALRDSFFDARRFDPEALEAYLASVAIG